LQNTEKRKKNSTVLLRRSEKAITAIADDAVDEEVAVVDSKNAQK
jgi:hypothetical protein